MEYWDKCACRFGDWNPWVACTAACNGYTYRTRNVWLYRNHTECPFKFETCASSNYAYELELCNTQKCANGGITNITNCLCTGGYTGKCCDDGRLFQNNTKYKVFRIKYLHKLCFIILLANFRHVHNSKYVLLYNKFPFLFEKNVYSNK